MVENNDVSIQINAREGAGFTVKTNGETEEVIAALTVGAVGIFNAAEKQFGRGLAGQMLATFLPRFWTHSPNRKERAKKRKRTRRFYNYDYDKR